MQAITYFSRGKHPQQKYSNFVNTCSKSSLFSHVGTDHASSLLSQSRVLLDCLDSWLVELFSSQRSLINLKFSQQMSHCSSSSNILLLMICCRSLMAYSTYSILSLLSCWIFSLRSNLAFLSIFVFLQLQMILNGFSQLVLALVISGLLLTRLCIWNC